MRERPFLGLYTASAPCEEMITPHHEHIEKNHIQSFSCHTVYPVRPHLLRPTPLYWLEEVNRPNWRAAKGEEGGVVTGRDDLKDSWLLWHCPCGQARKVGAPN